MTGYYPPPSSGSVTGAYVNRGNIDGSTNPNYPTAVNGDTYIVTVAGKVGGASGKSVEVGDMVIAKADNAGGTEASVGASWVVVQGNVAFTAAGLALATAADAAAQRTALGLGTIATQAASAVAITGGTITELTNFGVSMANNTAMTGFALGTLSDTTSRPLNVAQTWNNAGGTFTLIKAAATVTAANAASKLIDLCGGAAGTTSQFSVSASGYLTCKGADLRGATTYLPVSVLSDTLLFTPTASSYIGENSVYGANIYQSGGEGSNYTIGIKNSTNACKLRIYGTTTGSKYAQLTHDGTNAILSSSSGSVHITNLPTSNPGPGILWNNAGTPAIGT
jgi:hypothetical protein